MNISILGMISDFAKEQKLTIRNIYYKFDDNIPSAFYETVINYFKTAQVLYNDEPKLDGFYIEITDNYDVLFYFLGNNNKTKLFVKEDGKFFEDLPSAKIINESMFLTSIKALDNHKNKEIIENLPKEFKNRFLKNTNQVVNIEQIFFAIGYNIIEYMKYLEDLKEKIEESQRKEVEKLYFVEADASTNLTRLSSQTNNNQPNRKNIEIPINDRNNLLNSYSPAEQYEAISSNSTSTYYVKVFAVKEKCKLIMEPLEGNKYTKVVHLDTNALSKTNLRKIVIDSLELSRTEITKSQNISRHCHTTLDEYKKLLDYLIQEKDNGINYGVKKRIDEINKDKKR